MKNLIFLALMLASSALGFARTMLAAWMLPITEFGYYSAVMGGVSLAAMAISLGRLEATTKLYPRMWVAGRPDLIWRDAIQTVLLVGSWVFGLGIAALLILFSGLVLTPPAVVLLLTSFVWCTVIVTVCAAMIRSVASVAALQTFTLLRGLLPLVIVVPVLSSGNWVAVIAAENMAAFLLAVLTGIFIRRRLRTVGLTGDSELPKRNNADGRTLYLANLCSSSISLGDRALVTYLLGAAAGGAYGTIMLIVQAGNLLAGILSQKIGPEMVRDVYQGKSIKAAAAGLRFPAAALAVAAFFVIVFFTAAPALSITFTAFLAERGIGMKEIMLGSLLFVLQIFLIVQFLLVAADSERTVLRASIVAVVVFAFGVAISYQLGLGIWAYLVSGIVARALQLALLCHSVKLNSR